MRERFEEASVTSLFAEAVVSVEEGGMAFDGGARERKVSLDSPFVPTSDIAEREGEESVRKALEQLGGKFGAGLESACAVDADNESEGVCWCCCRWTKSWGRRIWRIHIYRRPDPSEYFFSDTSRGCCQYTRTANMLVFLLHSHKFFCL